MIALEVLVNGEPVCVAGADDLSVLSAIVNATGKLGNLTKPVRDGEDFDLSLRVGGLTSRVDSSDEHLNWTGFLELEIGDVVTVRVLELEKRTCPAKASQSMKSGAPAGFGNPRRMLRAGGFDDLGLRGVDLADYYLSDHFCS